MSYLSASENVGFSGITQNISDGSCATQYKMAVEGVSGSCSSEVNMFIHDGSGDEQSYIPHLNENFFHTKFKIDPNELYTFHDSDVIAGEITVSHTEDNLIFPEDIDVKSKQLDLPHKQADVNLLTNGIIKESKEVVLNGHYSPTLNSIAKNHIESKTVNAKVQKFKSQVNSFPKVTEVCRPSVQSSPNANSAQPTQTTSCPTTIVNKLSTGTEKAVSSSKCNTETFLDVFKREQGVTENTVTIKTESTASSSAVNTIKPPAPSKKLPAKSQSKPRKGRGPTVHEALQRIPQQHRALPLPNLSWHAPGEEMFQCGPLDGKKPNTFRQLESSSSDDDNMPEFELGVGPVCVEESAAESRGARLALRRAAMRRHVERAATSLNFAKDHKEYKALASLIKKQLTGQTAACRIPPQSMNHILAMRGMSSVLSLQERRRLRQSGWSGGESVRSEANTCSEERCTQTPLPCGRYCLSHVTLAPEQRLYAACAAVFAGGERCKQPLLPLQEQTPLCAEHAWKRDNYELLSRESKPPKTVRKRGWVPANRAVRAPRTPRRAKRRRRLVPKRPPPHLQSLSEINVCSNSSAYDSSEDTAMGGLSENEYMTTNNSHELEVGQVPPDDILDPSVLSQIPDEAFTEFFNQAETGAPFGEGLELAAALEAVLDERELDERTLDIGDEYPHSHGQIKTKMQVPPAVSMEISSSAPS